ncbi:ureidoglycolate lyase [Paracidovorax wautersii]|uniref:Ureidoglycolate lyase n=1 Tax=Paracidovorax wautersii TaxID=1177982 RepID=A0ABU1IAR3_9BURK|nr:ureidoglycolate lyase [Paracidovorax wautersii]MDR6213683.1 ureidoglycolate lyase [Paracidovorax wautersii]
MHADPVPPTPSLLVPQPLTTAAFAPYGTVLEAPETPGQSINAGNARRFDLVDDLQLNAAGGHALLALFRALPRSFPVPVRELERHVLGSQSFVPLGERRFVIVVAPAGPAPAATALRAFITNGQQGVTLHPGTWHHALLAVDGGDFIVLERAAEAVDCDLATLERALSLILHPQA